MKTRLITSDDGVELKCAVSCSTDKKNWIVLIIPFGLKVELAQSFFDYFENDFNIVTWESRLILSEDETSLSGNEFAIENHIADINAIEKALNIEISTLVGYCSGAGIALAAANKNPEKYSQLLLVHGEFTLLGDKACVTQVGADIDSLLPIASMSPDKAKFIMDRVSMDNSNTATSLPENIDINLPFKNSNYLYRYALNYLSYRKVDFESLAKIIKHKTVLLTGDLDKHTNIQSTMKIKELIENSEIHIDPQADHYGIVREKSLTLEKIANYLESNNEL
ncbi:hypothetical protein [Aliikangiella sp. IMCC44359]|uniref:hypothetical protein n=1 Tax=Aliikangiella sp. IMCC44359 TaxID=3459125 RepID=UPI00403A85BA